MIPSAVTAATKESREGLRLRKLAHLPLSWRPTTLWVRARRYQCADCAHIWAQGISQAAAPRAKLSRHTVCGH